MRQTPGTRPDRTLPPSPRRLMVAGAPIAIAGSLALTGAAAPPAVTERAAEMHDLALRPTAARAGMGDAALHASHAGAQSTAAQRVAAEVGADEYVVQPGDTVSAIAARHGLRTADVLVLNGLSWSTIIVPGQVLRLAGAPVDAAPIPSAPVGAATVEPVSSVYTVVDGDTIWAIALRSGASVDALLSANGLSSSSVIVPGQTIAIPGAAAVAPAAPAPEAVEPAPAPESPAPPSGEGTAYTIVAGDTISAIADRHGVSVQAVFDANALSAASIIYPGQTILVPAAAAAPSMTLVASSTSVPLDDEQAANARTIIAVGRELGLPDRAIMIALGTAMQESWLRNLDWGDRDSVGLFQQRPSMGWGSVDEARDPARATRVFFGGPADPNGSRTDGLLDITGWEAMSFADAAQAVQISAYPDRYAQWEQPAAEWLATLG